MPTTSALIAASEKYLRELEREGSAATKRLVSQYSFSLDRLKKQIDRLEKQMLEQPLTQAQYYRLDRYQSLIEQVGDELNRLGSKLATASQSVATNAATVGTDAGLAAIAGAFTMFNRATVERASSFVDEHSPLYQGLVRDYGRAWAEVIARQYVSGVALGWNPRRIAAMLRRTLTTAVPAHIETTIRTAQIWTYHTTQQTTWQQSGVVDYWVWHAALGQPRTCGSCIAKHGSKHPVTEALHDHHNGRCAQIPHVIDSLDLDIPSGESVFSSYSQQQQMDLARAAGWLPQWRAWQNGAINFSDLSQMHIDDVYGEMFSQASLKSLLGNNAAQYYERNQ